MVDRNSGRVTSQDLEVTSPEQVRNVVLVGPGQSGKTTLVDALLVAGGAIPRAGTIAEHTTVCDFEDSEHELVRAQRNGISSHRAHQLAATVA